MSDRNYIESIDPLFVEYKEVVKVFSKNLIEIVERQEGKIYVCAISRKMPRFLQLLQENLETIWSKMIVVTEFALPFLDWNRINKVILVDDAIYYGSTFNNIYKTICQLKKGIKIYPLCCIKAIEAPVLECEQDLKTIRKPRAFSHYFVNKLSRDFNRLSYPFEVEFPVFYDDEPSGIGSNSFAVNLQKAFGENIIQIPYRADNYTDNSYFLQDDDNEEYSILFSGTRPVINKIRIYKNKEMTRFVPMFTTDLLQSSLEDDNVFNPSTREYALWQFVRDNISCNDVTGMSVRYLIDKSLCMWYNFILSLVLWQRESEKIKLSLKGIGNVRFVLSKREFYLLFGDSLGEKIYDMALDFLQMSTSDMITLPEQIYSDLEELPTDFSFSSFYKEQQTLLISKAKNLDEACNMVYYLQNVMLDKLNRSFSMIDGMRLKYGNTIASVSDLISSYTSFDFNISNLHQWVDSAIDRATIVPQYIRVRENTESPKWIRVLRSGENEVPIISHWARFFMFMYKEACSFLGTKVLPMGMFNSLSSAIVYKHFPEFQNLFHYDVSFVRRNHNYILCIGKGNEKCDILQVIIDFNIFSTNGNFISLSKNILDDELTDATTILPQATEEKLSRTLKELLTPLKNGQNEEFSLPYFNTVMKDCNIIGSSNDETRYSQDELKNFVKRTIQEYDFNILDNETISRLYDIRQRYIHMKYGNLSVATKNGGDYEEIYNRISKIQPQEAIKMMNLFSCIYLCLIPGASKYLIDMVHNERVEKFKKNLEDIPDADLRKNIMSILISCI